MNDEKACGELNIAFHMPSNPVPSSDSRSPNMINLELMDLFDERFCKVNSFTTEERT